MDRDHTLVTQHAGPEGGGDFAVFSEDLQYRYRLVRHLSCFDVSRCVFIMLNPSRADAFTNDPTVTRCIGFARQWGYTSLEVLNLFAWRATNPLTLYGHPDPVGYHNDDILQTYCRDVAKVVCAWGSHGVLNDRAQEVETILRRLNIRIFALVFTQAGQPGHPLYLKKTVQPIEWELKK